MCEDEGLEIGSGWFVLDDFMGGEGDAVVAFFDAVRADCRRMAKEGRLTQIPVMRRSQQTEGGVVAGGHGKIAWADGKELENKFAAIAEVIDAMERLPAEINRHALKIYSELWKGEEVQVCKVARVQGHGSSVALISMGKGDRQPTRIDSGIGGEGDVGHCLSCVYFCGDAGSRGATMSDEGGDINRSGAIRLTNTRDGTSSLIEAKSDRLVLWRSQDIENERLEILGAEESLFAIHVYLHGCITTKESILESVAQLKDAKISPNQK